MAFDISALSAYVENINKQIAVQAVNGAKTAKLLIDNGAYQDGVKGSHTILKMDVDVSFQDGSSCGRSVAGAMKFNDKQISVAAIADMQNLCPKSLKNTYFAQFVAKGQNPESETFDPSFLNQVFDLKNAKIQEALEIAIWQGDTASLDANLKRFDGLLKQINAASDKIAITETGADVVAKLQSVYNAMPVKVRKQSDFRIFISEEMFDEYVQAMAAKNLYKPVEDMKLFGTTAMLEVTPGLNGTQYVVAARISDLQYASDVNGEETKVSFKLSQETNQWYMDYHFAAGVAAVYTNQIGIADFAS